MTHPLFRYIQGHVFHQRQLCKHFKLSPESTILSPSKHTLVLAGEVKWSPGSQADCWAAFLGSYESRSDRFCLKALLKANLSWRSCLATTHASPEPVYTFVFDSAPSKITGAGTMSFFVRRCNISTCQRSSEVELSQRNLCFWGSCIFRWENLIFYSFCVNYGIQIPRLLFWLYWIHINRDRYFFELTKKLTMDFWDSPHGWGCWIGMGVGCSLFV